MYTVASVCVNFLSRFLRSTSGMPSGPPDVLLFKDDPVFWSQLTLVNRLRLFEPVVGLYAGLVAENYVIVWFVLCRWSMSSRSFFACSVARACRFLCPGSMCFINALVVRSKNVEYHGTIINYKNVVDFECVGLRDIEFIDQFCVWVVDFAWIYAISRPEYLIDVWKERRWFFMV